MSEEQLEEEYDKLRAENQRLRRVVRAARTLVDSTMVFDEDTGRLNGVDPVAMNALDKALDALDEYHGPRPACREYGMGGDVGGTEPNPIPF